MTPDQQIRLEVLKLLKLPDIANPDLSRFLERASALEAYVAGAGQAAMPRRDAPQPLPPQVRTSQPLQAPARK